MFPSEEINEASPLKHWMKNVALGDTPVFRVNHLDKLANKDGLLVAIRKSGQKNVFRPCLILETSENCVHLFIGSTRPRLLNRWFPIEESPLLEGMPNNLAVKTEPDEAFRREGYICFTTFSE